MLPNLSIKTYLIQWFIGYLLIRKLSKTIVVSNYKVHLGIYIYSRQVAKRHVSSLPYRSANQGFKDGSSNTKIKSREPIAQNTTAITPTE